MFNNVLKSNEAFMVLDARGQARHEEHGLYLHDTRFLRQFSWNFPRFQLLTTEVQDSAELVQQWSWIDGPSQSMGLKRTLSLKPDGFTDRVLIENTSLVEEEFSIELELKEDFQDLFEVRDWQQKSYPRTYKTTYGDIEQRYEYESADGLPFGVHVQFSERPSNPNQWHMRLAPKSRWVLEVQVQLHSPLNLKSEETTPVPTPQEWQRRFRDVNLSVEDEAVWQQALEDIRALLIQTPQGLYPAAGTPWFVAPFGRDALWTAHMIMPWASDIVESVLRYLAVNQGQVEDEMNEEAPGKVLHEVRKGELSRTEKVPFLKYYGTVDATPLFIALLEDFWETTQSSALVRELQPNWESMLTWIQRYQHPDTGMLVFTPSGSGLAVQSWKDSADPMCHANGELAHPPLAVSEVQGYAYRAFKAASRFYTLLENSEEADRWNHYAEDFKRRFNELFWNEALQTFAMALDFHDQPLEVLSSDPGQLLWSGIVENRYAESLVNTLFSSELWSGWGLRTLGTREVRYNPLSYHNGSVWPHDTAIFAGGLSRYGFHEQVKVVREALFSLAKTQADRRLPELIGGYPRGRDLPTPYPAACRPQAWSAASLLYLQRLLTRA